MYKNIIVSIICVGLIYLNAQGKEVLPTKDFNPIDTVWSTIAMPVDTPDRITHGAAYNPVNDKIYMFGGTPDGSTGSNVNLCQEFDPVNNTWVDKASMPTAKGWIQGACVRGKIYAIGGYNNSTSAIAENVCYDPATNTWSLKAPSPRIRCMDLEAVWRDSLIYVIGGTNLTIDWPNVDIYNPFTNTWQAGTSFPTPISGGDAAIIGDTIYLVKASNGPGDTAYLYKGTINPANPTQITWIRGPMIPDSWQNFNGGAAAINNKVYWLGGSQIHIYTPGCDTFGEFIPYPISISKTQMISRTASVLQELYVIAGDSGNNWSPPNRRYMKIRLENASTDFWTPFAMPTNTPDRKTHGAVYNPVNDKIYMFGGSAGTNTNLCQEYNPVNNTWVEKAPMPTAKGWIQGACARGKIYAIGGLNNSYQAINENACYDPNTNIWSIKAPRPRNACADLEAVWRDSLIYVMGGHNLSVGWTYVDIYNPFTNTWSSGTPMPLPGDLGDATIIGDTIYIPDALNRGTSSCWPNLYKGAINPSNPNQITWIVGPALAYPTMDFAATNLNGNVYWLGGFMNGITVTGKLFVYDRITNTIGYLADYIVPISSHQMVSRPSSNEIYALDGYHDAWLGPLYYKHTFSSTHDVGCTYVQPTGTFFTGSYVPPLACSLYNFGEVAESYRFWLKIDNNLVDSGFISAHSAGTAIGWVFNPYGFTEGTHVISCSTRLNGDMNNANDKKTGTVTILPATYIWSGLAPVPPGASGKKPKAGSSITGLEATGKISFLKASNTPDFHIYTPDADDGSWLDITVPLGTKETGDGKNPKKGASIAGYEPTKSIFMLRGSNTVGFWEYKTDTVNGAWIKRANIPYGAKRPKDASGLVSVTKAGRDYIFAMKGSKTNEFYLYDIIGDSWLKVKSPPNGNSGKLGYKKGSCLCYDGNDFVYILKGNFGDLFKYDVELDSWIELMRYDHRYFVSRDGKKKKPKDGAGLVYYDNNVYMLKGGNTNEFWKYDITANNWIQMGPAAVWDVPIGSGKRVKGGGCITRLGNNFYIVKGGNTNEFYCHPVPTESIASKANQLTEDGVMGKKVGISVFQLTINPNPAKNITQVRYTLPNAEPVRVKLYNVTGSLIKSYTHSTPTKQGLFTIDANDLSAGIYILRFESGKTKVTRKLVLEK